VLTCIHNAFLGNRWSVSWSRRKLLQNRCYYCGDNLDPQYEWLKQLSASSENKVFGLARTPSTVEAKLATDKISNVKLISADLESLKSLEAAASTVAETTGGSLDYLIVNGVYQDPEADLLGPTEFIGQEALLYDYMNKSLNVNVVGAMYAINSFLPLVRKSSIKKIIVMSTGLADTETQRKGNIPYFSIYSSMKAALNLVVARYAIELKQDGIIFLALSPGLVNTSEKPRKFQLRPQYSTQS